MAGRKGSPPQNYLSQVRTSAAGVVDGELLCPQGGGGGYKQGSLGRGMPQKDKKVKDHRKTARMSFLADRIIAIVNFKDV